MTMKIALTIAALALAAAGTSHALRVSSLSFERPDAVTGDAPWFCHGIDCPRYSVVNKTDEYEVRNYEGGDWVRTRLNNTGFTLAMGKGFARLFEYISGANEDKQKIAMTAPVATYMKPDDSGKAAEKDYCIGFFVPFDYQGKAPTPTSDDVEIVSYPSMTFYVLQFGGYATEQSLVHKAAVLAHQLSAEGIDVDTHGFVWAGYDPPYRVTGRHNEIWLAAKESPSMAS